MMPFSLSTISASINGKLISHGVDKVSEITIDSRNIKPGTATLFCALTSGNRDGHKFIEHALTAGAASILLSDPSYVSDDASVTWILVEDTLEAIQMIAAHHRKQFDIPVIGITGSYAKTIIKEWLSEALDDDYQIIKTPKSYNSQIGVPLSVLPMGAEHQLGIFEAGISTTGEMEQLASIIKPSIGIFTNIGSAHSEGFADKHEHLSEKIKFFTSCDTIIYCHDHEDIHVAIQQANLKGRKISWGDSLDADVRFIATSDTLETEYNGHNYTIDVKGFVGVSRENICHVIVTLILLGFDSDKINHRISLLKPMPMRLEVIAGFEGNTIINDSYTSDPEAFRYALEYTRQLYPHQPLYVITSQQTYSDQIASLVEQFSVSDAFILGQGQEVDQLTYSILEKGIRDSVFLIKGKRSDRLERVSHALSESVHVTQLQINLGAIGKNLQYYSSLIKEETQVIAVIKASAYGSGSSQIARYLQRLRVDYFAVALIDEAIQLRKAQIVKPILIFNFFTMSDAHLLWEYDLEPEIFSLNQLRDLVRVSYGQTRLLRVHLKFDTGMHRLGFSEEDIPEILSIIEDAPQLKVESLFSHLSSSEDKSKIEVTRQQAGFFEKVYNTFVSKSGYKPWRHLLNTAGVANFNEYQYDAIRLGLGLYGIDEAGIQSANLTSCITMTTIILQIRKLSGGDKVGYGQAYEAKRDCVIAIIGAGYADGIPRNAAQIGWMCTVKDLELPFIGNVCMDVSFIDITEAGSMSEGDSIQIYQSSSDIQQKARQAGTIAYELLSQIPQRVKRVYVEE